MSALEAWIHQGRYDSMTELRNLRSNALEKGRLDILDAVHQRLRKVHPKEYQRVVGPLRARHRDARFKCYCNNPKALQDIFKDIMADAVHAHCLTCDACWQEDLTVTWGHDGWASKVIPKRTWDALCRERANYKFVE